jgi:hypothetical protein
VRIKRIICLLFPHKNPYVCGFHYTLTGNGITVSGRIQGGESNVMAALAMNEDGWLCDYYTVRRDVKESEVIELPHAGSRPDDIRTWVKEQVKIKLKERRTSK